MKRKFLFAIFAIIGIGLNAQTWSIQDPNVPDTNYAVEQICPLDSNIVWVTAISGKISTHYLPHKFSRTQDGGSTWVSGTFNGMTTSDFVTSLAPISYTKAFAVTADGSAIAKFWKTVDGGANWTQVSGILNNPPTTFADGVFFWTPAKGFCYGDPVGGSFQIYYTSDSGNTWIQVPAANIPAPLNGETPECNFYGASIMEGGYAAFLTFRGRIIKTSDYGVHWNVTTSNPFNTSSINWTRVLISYNNIIAGINGPNWNNFKTINDGAIWNDYNTINNFHNYVVSYVPYTNSLLFSGGLTAYSSGGLSYSNDNGLTWTDISNSFITPGITNIYSIGFSDINHGWVGIHDGHAKLLKYTNNALLSNATEITAFTVPNQVGSAIINSSTATITISMPYGTNVTALVPTITLSSGATVNPNSGVVQDFTSPKQYTVTAQNGTTNKIWTVTVTVLTGVESYAMNTFSLQPNPTNDMVTFNLPNYNTAQLNIVDITGKTVLEQRLQGITEIKTDVSHLQKGIYFVKLNIDNQTMIKKLIIY